MTKIYEWVLDGVSYVKGYRDGEFAYWLSDQRGWVKEDWYSSMDEGRWVPVTEYGEMPIEDAKLLITVIDKL